MNQFLSNSSFRSELGIPSELLSQAVLAKGTSVPCFWVAGEFITPDDPFYYAIIQAQSNGKIRHVEDDSETETIEPFTGNPDHDVDITHQPKVGYTIIERDKDDSIVPPPEDKPNDAWQR
jgi:hypothetical protein